MFREQKHHLHFVVTKNSSIHVGMDFLLAAPIHIEFQTSKRKRRPQISIFLTLFRKPKAQTNIPIAQKSSNLTSLNSSQFDAHFDNLKNTQSSTSSTCETAPLKILSFLSFQTKEWHMMQRSKESSHNHEKEPIFRSQTNLQEKLAYTKIGPIY